ncbi:MAG: aldehyde dehydrogenase family protein [Planctomycetota bacterium]|jgi:succinate-semialdehyde dehydrogenase/glutarate-semialdehyde dehydrogenase
MSTLTTSETVLVSKNPATGEPVGEVPVTPAGQIDAIVQRARAAQPAWAALGLERRAELLRRVGPMLMERAEELGRLLTREMGKPLAEGIGEVKECGNALGATLDEIVEALQPDELADERVTSTIYHDPFGVCAAITPWNFPLAMPHWTVIPALAAGNTVVLKPSEETPLIAQAYVELLLDILPPDVLDVVHGTDAQGKALVAADVDLIAFTGSRHAGKHLLGAASGGLKRVILELGGKDPLIVLDDADIEEAAKFAVRNSFRNAGQVCVSTERIYVHDAVAEPFETAVARLCAEQKIGEGTDEGVTVGPMINKRQRDHVLQQIDEAVEGGARVIAGGTSHPEHFVTPTVLGDVTHEMDIMRTETFGPVACIARFRDDDEAVRLANDTPYGLGAVVFGTDTAKAAEVARRLDAGMIGINKGCGGATGSPWVGAKESGFGFHSGKEGHRHFTQPRVVSIPRT